MRVGIGSAALIQDMVLVDFFLFIYYLFVYLFIYLFIYILFAHCLISYTQAKAFVYLTWVGICS